jgi:ubiquinone/menaquinone biosynthesis C-methylase UbiE
VAHVCHWWLGHLLVIPLRRLWQNPATILGPFVREGMTVLEPGPGMGFFTLDLARLVGPNGKVVVADVQPKMLAGLDRRSRRAGLADRIETRLVLGESLPVDDLEGKVDFALAFAMVHEVPDTQQFLSDVFRALGSGKTLLIAEPRGHVTAEAFAHMLTHAEHAGFRHVGRPSIRSSHTVVLQKP